MVKFITKTICAALILMLCCSAVFAQKEKPKNPKDKSVIEKSERMSKLDISSRKYSVSNNVNGVSRDIQSLRGAKGSIGRAFTWLGAELGGGYYSFDADDIWNFTEIVDNWDWLISGECVDGILYAYDEDGTFYIIDAETGMEIEIIPYICDPYYVPNDMSYDYTTGIMYGLSWDELLTVDLETGEVTILEVYFYDEESWDDIVFMVFAIDENGNAYGVSDWYYEYPPGIYDVNGDFFRIDMNTGECTYIGATGVEVWYYPACMAFDFNTGLLYFINLGQGGWEDFTWNTIDVETGEALYISDGYIITGLHFPFTITEPCYPASNLSVEYTDDCEAILTWTAPAADAVFNVYRDGDIIAAEITELTYLDNDFDITVGHTWTVTVVCENGESDPVEVEEDACDPVGISKLASKVSIYPNPAKNLVYIEGADIVKVEIYNMFGQLIDTYKGKVIDVSKFNTGMYLFKTFDVNNNFVITNISVMR